MSAGSEGARRVAAVVMAGDRGAARAVKGRAKVYLELGGRPLVALVVETLQRVPEVSEVWVVGDSARLEAALASLAPLLVKPLHVIEQFRNLYENAWESYRRLLPGAGPQGRDPQGDDDLDTAALYLSGDLPFATPEEISAFIRAARARGTDYTVGVVGEESVESFYPAAPGSPGIRPAYFNLREGRVRQSNLQLVRPGRIGNRHYIEEMYEHRYQKQLGNMVALGWRILRSSQGGLRILFYYTLMHLAALAHRRGWQRLADRLRSWVPIARVEECVGKLLRTSFGIVRTECGGCAIDIDLDSEYEAAEARFEEWRAAQRERARALYGSLASSSAGAP
jgi:GTP:adenosylcobinamide-phosphate guanylyltransferase